MASMVVIACPTAALTGVTHDRLGIPSRCTVQAPQSATPQPNFVPFMPSTSRSTHSKGMSGDTSTVCDLPLIFSVAIAIPPGRQFHCIWQATARAQSTIKATDTCFEDADQAERSAIADRSASSRSQPDTEALGAALALAGPSGGAVMPWINTPEARKFMKGWVYEVDEDSDYNGGSPHHED